MKAQLAIEFFVMIGLAVVLAMVLLIAAVKVSSDKIDEKTYYEIDDMGTSIQQELMLAIELENGYIRKINLPQTVNGNVYNITTGNSSAYNGYFEIGYKGTSLYYVIPVLNGSLKKGDNTIYKINNSLSITN